MASKEAPLERLIACSHRAPGNQRPDDDPDSKGEGNEEEGEEFPAS